MAHVPQYQLSRPELIKSLRWLSACAVDERDMMILTYAERLMTATKMYCHDLLILAALQNGCQTRADVVEVTGFSETTVRRWLCRLERESRVEVRRGDNRSKLYFVR